MRNGLHIKTRTSANNKRQSAKCDSTKQTMRLGNVRSHIKFRPRSSTVSLNCLPNEEETKKINTATCRSTNQ